MVLVSPGCWCPPHPHLPNQILYTKASVYEPLEPWNLVDFKTCGKLGPQRYRWMWLFSFLLLFVGNLVHKWWRHSVKCEVHQVAHCMVSLKCPFTAGINPLVALSGWSTVQSVSICLKCERRYLLSTAQQRRAYRVTMCLAVPLSSRLFRNSRAKQQILHIEQNLWTIFNERSLLFVCSMA